MADTQQDTVKETRRKRVSKKSKKSWRKHTDIHDVEEHLEEVRQEERTGGVAANKADEDLFCLDNDAVQETEKITIDKRKKEKEPLTCHKFLQPDTRVPAIAGRKQKTDKRVRKNSSSDDEDQEPKVKKTSFKRRCYIVPETANSDIWDPAAEPVKEEDSNPYLSAVKEIKVKKPVSVGRKTSNFAAVEVCHPGASYNPTFEDHQILLAAANNVEVAKLKEIQKLKKELNFPTAKEFANNPTWLEEMSQGLFDEKDEDEAENEESEEEDSVGVVPAVRAEDRKTRQQKSKAKIQKEEKQRLQEAKGTKVKVNEVFRVRSLKKEINQVEKQNEEKRNRKKELQIKNADKPKTIGKYKYEAPNLEVQLSGELTGNLRNLKPEGNVFEDRFKSLQKRNIIEPRKRVKPHRKFRLKTYTKRSHKKKNVKEQSSKILSDDS